MSKHRICSGIASALTLTALLGTSFALRGTDPLAAAESTELLGGPAARGAGSNRADFNSRIYVSSISVATGHVEFFSKGARVESIAFSLPARGVLVLTPPDALDGAGAFLYRVLSDAPVNAWSETFNEVPSGRFGVSIAAISPSELLNPGDEASGGGADASTSGDTSRSRTNVGMVCSPSSGHDCSMEVAVFDAGALLGTGQVTAIPGAVGQISLAVLVPAAEQRSGLALRMRVQSGSGKPYAIRNNNGNGDGADIPFSVTRAAFSTAPTISTFTVSPSSGCPSQTFTASWTTVGASRVTISGVGGDLPPNGSTSLMLLSTSDLVLTAFASTGESTTQSRRVSIQQPPSAPTPSPSSGTVAPGGVITGILASFSGTPDIVFTQRGSGSPTFTLSGANFTYTAGSDIGTDVVKITVHGACGDGVATFTADVQAPGSPVIESFTADPTRGCSPADIVLAWATRNATHVTISGIEGSFNPGGFFGVTITMTSTFTLTAYGADNKRVTKTITVPVDMQAFPPTVSPTMATVYSGDYLMLTVTGVPNPGNITFAFTRRDSGQAMVFSNGVMSMSEVQQVTVTGASGTFTLTFNGQTTSSLAFNATAASVQAALNALPSIGGAGGSVSVTQSGGTYTVTFGGSLSSSDQPQMTAAGTGGAGASVATLVDGGGAGLYTYHAGMGSGQDQVRFYYGNGCGYAFATFNATVLPQP